MVTDEETGMWESIVEEIHEISLDDVEKYLDEFRKEGLEYKD